MNGPYILPIAEAKRLLPIVPDLWQRLALPGEAPRLNRKFKSPLRPDRSPSCVIYAGKDGCQRFADKSRNVDVDAIGFLAEATGLDRREACRKFLELAGGGSFGGATLSPAPPLPQPEPARGKPVLPADLHRGSPGELERLAGLRGLSVAGVTLASARGLLRFGTVCRVPCWLVLDASGQLAQARRLDGQPFPAFGDIGTRKSHTLKGSRQGWPLGIREAADFPAVLLVEGGPDLLAACHFIARAKRSDLAPVAMLGAGNRIPADALPSFAGKRVRIFLHADPAGRDAAARWAWELEIESGGNVGPVDAFRLDGLTLPGGQLVSDLNDVARMHPAAQPEGLLP